MVVVLVSLAAFYSNDSSSNPAEVYNFYGKLKLKRTKINEKEAGVSAFEKELLQKQTSGQRFRLWQNRGSNPVMGNFLRRQLNRKGKKSPGIV